MAFGGGGRGGHGKPSLLIASHGGGGVRPAAQRTPSRDTWRQCRNGGFTIRFFGCEAERFSALYISPAKPERTTRRGRGRTARPPPPPRAPAQGARWAGAARPHVRRGAHAAAVGQNSAGPVNSGGPVTDGRGCVTGWPLVAPRAVVSPPTDGPAHAPRSRPQPRRAAARRLTRPPGTRRAAARPRRRVRHWHRRRPRGYTRCPQWQPSPRNPPPHPCPLWTGFVSLPGATGPARAHDVDGDWVRGRHRSCVGSVHRDRGARVGRCPGAFPAAPRPHATRAVRARASPGIRLRVYARIRMGVPRHGVCRGGVCLGVCVAYTEAQAIFGVCPPSVPPKCQSSHSPTSPKRQSSHSPTSPKVKSDNTQHVLRNSDTPSSLRQGCPPPPKPKLLPHPQCLNVFSSRLQQSTISQTPPTCGARCPQTTDRRTPVHGQTLLLPCVSVYRQRNTWIHTLPTSTVGVRVYICVQTSKYAHVCVGRGGGGGGGVR